LKSLILLDLDHTIIYGSYAENETADLLFQYNKYLKVYERPSARELIAICKDNADIIVYTTALRPYALKICNKLNINPIELLSRKNCLYKNGSWQKKVKPEWIKKYDKIIIIDDSPNVWIINKIPCIFLIPTEFRGNLEDNGLIKIINEYQFLKFKNKKS
jgi:TFIIF-interacting CTD phosphatase-like protein